MSWRERQAQAYPPDEHVRYRQLDMPVEAPPRPRPRKRRPVPGCGQCGGEPCARHGYDVLASIGAAPAEPLSPDEHVHDWREVG
jgi:hypothetical protein